MCNIIQRRLGGVTQSWLDCTTHFLTHSVETATTASVFEKKTKQNKITHQYEGDN